MTLIGRVPRGIKSHEQGGPSGTIKLVSMRMKAIITS